MKMDFSPRAGFFLAAFFSRGLGAGMSANMFVLSSNKASSFSAAFCFFRVPLGGAELGADAKSSSFWNESPNVRNLTNFSLLNGAIE